MYQTHDKRENYLSFLISLEFYSAAFEDVECYPYFLNMVFVVALSRVYRKRLGTPNIHNSSVDAIVE